jgi:hypothetical protein
VRLQGKRPMNTSGGRATSLVICARRPSDGRRNEPHAYSAFLVSTVARNARRISVLMGIPEKPNCPTVPAVWGRLASVDTNDERDRLAARPLARERSRLFDQQAEAYDRFRPTYPDAVIDELLGPVPAGLDVRGRPGTPRCRASLRSRPRRRPHGPCRGCRCHR